MSHPPTANAGRPGDGPLIVIASNRGPFSFRRKEDGRFAIKRGEGGLVTALAALAESHDVLWISAALSRDDQDWAREHADGPATVGNMKLRMIIPERDAYRQYYNVIANPLLWFIQHELWDSPRNPVITKATWDAWHDGYVRVNRQFADAIVEAVDNALGSVTGNATGNATGNTGRGVARPVIIFPQDYHLYLVPMTLRQRLGETYGDRVQIQPFLHIPWPGTDAWRVLPDAMRTEILASLLHSDRVGFQTTTDAFNFVQTCRLYLPDAHSRGSRDSIEYRGRTVGAKAYPISIDVDKVRAIQDSTETKLLKRQLITTIGDAKLILRTDRIEPSKNILRGLLAFRALLAQHPEHRGKVKLLQLLVPSRLEVREYSTYLQEVMAEAAMINADYSDEFWEPVRTIIGNNYPRAIAAMEFYDVLMVNPVTDGMNLVAKEGVLVNQKDGVLVLSEYAGAFYELGEHALTISPYDVHSTAEALHQALTMTTNERHERAEALRAIVEENDVKQWFAHQMADAQRALKSQPSRASTPGTPGTSTSAMSRTRSGVPEESTPTPSA